MRTRIQSTTRLVSSIVVLITLVLLVMPGPVVAQGLQGEVKIEGLTRSFFGITSPKDKVILTNPWLSNPDGQTSLERIGQAEIILASTGHREEVGETVEDFAAARPCSNQVLAISGCCKQRQSVNHAWRKTNLIFKTCQGRERDDVFKPVGRFWWDVSC